MGPKEEKAAMKLPPDGGSLEDERPESVLSRKIKIAYGMGHMLNDMCAALVYTYSLLFLIYVEDMSSLYAGIVMFVGQAGVAMFTPLAGIIIDRTRKMKFGKHKLWHLLGTIVVAVSIPLIFSVHPHEVLKREEFLLAYFSVIYFLHQAGWAFVQISHLSVVSMMTEDIEQRMQLYQIRTAFSVVSNIVVYVTVSTVFALYEPRLGEINEEDAVHFQVVVWTVLGAGLVCCGVFHALVRELPPAGRVSFPAVRTPRLQVLARPGLYKVTLAYMMARLYGNMTQTLLLMYIYATLHLSNANLGVIPLIMYVGCFLATFVRFPLSSQGGRKLTYLAGGIVASTGIVAVLLGRSDLYKHYLIHVTVGFLGSAQCIFVITGLSIATEFIGEDINNISFVYGIMSFCEKVLSGTVILVVMSLAPFFPEAYFQYATVIVCTAAVLIGSLTCLTLKIEKLRPSH